VWERFFLKLLRSFATVSTGVLPFELQPIQLLTLLDL